MAHPEQLRNKVCKTWLIFLWLPVLACNFRSPCNAPSFVNTVLHNIEIRNGLYVYGKQPYTGCLFSLQNEGKDTLYSAHIDQGRENGLFKKWYPDGELMEVRLYQEGKKTGIHTGYWPNGRPRFRYQFRDDLYEGCQYQWYEDGRCQARKNYRKGQEAGMQQEWNQEGKLIINYQALNGRQYGNIGKKNCASLWHNSVYRKPVP